MHASQIYNPADVGTYYDEWTERYIDTIGDVIQGGRSSSTEELLAYTMHSAGFQVGDRILDAGCGVAGPAIFFAQNLDVTVDGVTISGVQKEIAESKIGAAGLAGRVKITQGDFHELDKIYPVNHFDRAVFLESLGHADDPAPVMRSAYQVVRNGGYIYVKDFFARESHDEALSTKISGFTSNVNRHYRYNSFDLGRTIHALRSAGWHILYMRRPAFALDWAATLRFETKHGINLFEGVGEPFHAVEWFEILCQKVC